MTWLRAEALEQGRATDLAATRELLAGLGPPLDDATVAELRRFAARHDDALLRSCAPGHFTGSAAVLDATATQLLVLFHRKARRWLQPGGHADGVGDLAAVAWREASEESGIDGLQVWSDPVDVDIHEVRFPDAPPHLHLDVRFLVLAPPGAEPVGNHESEAVRWVRPAELPALDPDASLRRLVDAALRIAPSLPPPVW